MLTMGVPLSVSAPVPVFWMVKVRVMVPLLTAVEPKSVSSAEVGVASPLVMLVLLPWRLISGDDSKAKPRPVREAWFLRAGFLSIG
jgi:hypothetical protein